MSNLPVASVVDRRTAAAMHVGTIFFPFVVPIIALVVARDRPFVAYHAKKSLKETIILQVMIFMGGIISLVFTLSNLLRDYRDGWQHFSIWPILLKAVIVWLILGLLEVFNALSALRNARDAYRGIHDRKSIT